MLLLFISNCYCAVGTDVQTWLPEALCEAFCFSASGVRGAVAGETFSVFKEVGGLCLFYLAFPKPNTACPANSVITQSNNPALCPGVKSIALANYCTSFCGARSCWKTAPLMPPVQASHFEMSQRETKFSTDSRS